MVSALISSKASAERLHSLGCANMRSVETRQCIVRCVPRGTKVQLIGNLKQLTRGCSVSGACLSLVKRCLRFLQSV